MDTNPYSPPRDVSEEESGSRDSLNPSDVREDHVDDVPPEHEFVVGALQVAIDQNHGGHVGAEDVCRWVLQIAYGLNGDDAKLMLDDLELGTSEKLGTVVFDLVNMGLFHASENDSPDDWIGLYDTADNEETWRICWDQEGPEPV